MTRRRRHPKRRPKKSDRILQVFKEAARPLLMKELLTLLTATPAQSEAVTLAVDKLVADGRLVSLKGGRFGLADKMNLVVGELSVHPDGFGFVTPESGGKDIYLTAVNLKDAWHGDRVVVRIEGRRGRRREGRVIRILSRRLTEVLGALSQAGDTYFVEPEDEHLLFNLIIPAEHLQGAVPGQMVRAAVTHYPTGHLNPQGVITEILGDVEDAAVQTRLVILKYDLPDEFPPAVLAAAAKIDPDLSAKALKGRMDLRQLPMVTIDGETARDFDDGVCVVKKPGGAFILYVSIADVAYYVKPGSAMDLEADQRGTSVYFPQRAVHMLPPKLATNVCSLIPGEDRLAVTAILNFDRRGRRKSFTFTRSVVRNHARLTYRLVDDLLVKKDRGLRGQYRPFLKMLAQMTDLCGRSGPGREGLAGGHPPAGPPHVPSAHRGVHDCGQ
jgi:ribonuclease R